MLPTSPRLLLNPASNGFGAILARASFRALFMQGTAGILDSIKKSGVTPTYTRATTATITDQDLKLNAVLSGELRLGGFRRVRNLAASSASIAAWSTANGATVATPTFTAVNTNSYVQSPALAGLNTTGIFVVSVTLSVSTGSAAFDIQGLDASDGSDATLARVTVTTTPVRYSITCNMSASATFSGNLAVRLGNVNAGTAGIIVTVADYQVEEVTGQSNQNPGDRVSAGVLSAPYQGAFVDGVAYLPTLNGNTVASNVVTEATGPSINGNSNFGALPGASGAYFSTPDSVAASITGDIDIRVKVAMDAWVPAVNTTLIAKSIYGAAGTGSYFIYIDTAGKINAGFDIGVSVPTLVSTSATGFVNGTSHWIRGTRSATTGKIDVYTSDDGITWTSAGTVTSTAGSLIDTALAVTVGTNSNDTLWRLAGKVYRAQIYNGINGTLAVDFNPNSWTSGATWASATGEVWTINGNAAVVPVSLGGYLAEPGATNLCLQSEDFGTTWVPARATNSLNAVVAPNGTTTADNLVEDATAANSHLTQQAFVIAANTLTTIALYAKRAAGTRNVALTLNAGANQFQAKFDLSNGTVNGSSAAGDGTITASSVTALANGWYRCAVSGIFSAATANPTLSINLLDATFATVYNGDGASSISVWGCQLVTGNQVGLINSYIPTVAATVTRNADVLTYATTGWLNANAGTLYAEWFNSTSTSSFTAVIISDGTGNNFSRITFNGTTIVHAAVTTGGVSQSDLSAAPITGGAVAKAVSIWQLNDFAGFANNTTLGTDAAGTIPTMTQIDIGSSIGAAQYGHYVRTVLYVPTRTSNAQAQSLTV